MLPSASEVSSILTSLADVNITIMTNTNCCEYITKAPDKVKVKCVLVQALRLCTGRTAHSGSRGIALLFLDHGTSRG